MDQKQAVITGAAIAITGVFVAAVLVVSSVARHRNAQTAPLAASAGPSVEELWARTERDRLQAAASAAAVASAEAARRAAQFIAMTPAQRREAAVREGRTSNLMAPDPDELYAAAKDDAERVTLRGLVSASRSSAACRDLRDGEITPVLPISIANVLYNARIRDIRSLEKTSIGEARKDSRANRGKWIEASGTILQIQREGSVFFGLMMTSDAKPISFVTSGETRGLVEDSPATFVGLFGQQYNFANVSGGQTQALLLIGHFRGQGFD